MTWAPKTLPGRADSRGSHVEGDVDGMSSPTSAGIRRPALKTRRPGPGPSTGVARSPDRYDVGSRDTVSG